jgi:phospholipase/carboxylesterase
MSEISRRRFGGLAGSGLVWLAFGGCALEASEANDGHLVARPRSTIQATSARAGELGLDRSRDAILQLPSSKTASPLPLLLLFHGAGGSGKGVLKRLGSAPEEAGVAVLAPDSRGSTWDAIRSGFGRDVTFINRALERVFEMVPIDPARIAVGGFSDGATYALSLGIINGDLFSRVVAFSPGFVVDGNSNGTPEFFISHGTADPILPIDRCSRAIVRDLEGRGYRVAFREFSGGHEVPSEIAREALRWVAGAQSRI